MSRLPLPQSLQITPLSPEMILLMEELNTAPITAERIRVWTNSDPLWSRAQQFVQSGWPDLVQDVQLKPYVTRKDELSGQDGCICWGNWGVIPKASRGDMLRELHEAHPGETRMKRLARMFFWWPGLDHAIEQEVNGCHECQIAGQIDHWHHLYPRPWSRLHINFARPFKGQMLLVVSDWCTLQVVGSSTNIYNYGTSYHSASKNNLCTVRFTRRNCVGQWTNIYQLEI